MTNVIVGAVLALIGGYLFRLMEARYRLKNSIRLLITELEVMAENLEDRDMEEMRPELQKSLLDLRAISSQIDPLKFEEFRSLYRELFELIHVRKLDFKNTLNLVVRMKHKLQVISGRLGDGELGPEPYRSDPPTAGDEP